MKKYFTYIITNMIGMLGISLYILADTYFISKGVGPLGLSALNIVLPFWSVISAISIMISVGASTKYAIEKGVGLTVRANKVFSSAVYISLFLSIILMLISIFFTPFFVRILGANEKIYDMTYTYFKILVLFSPAFIFNSLLVSFTRNDQKPKLAMICMFMGSFLNIILDYIFVIVFNMGMFGAVLATGVCPLFNITIILLNKREYKFKKEGFDISIVKRILYLGFPSFISDISTGIVLFVFNILILKYSGNIGLAAYGIIANIAYVVVAIFTGLSQGMQAYVSRNLESRKKYWKLTTTIAIIIGILMYALIYLYSNEIVLVFNSENNLELKFLATRGVKIYFLNILFTGINIVNILYFTAINKSNPAKKISLLRGLILIIPITYILSYILQIDGIWLSVPITELLTLLISIKFILF